MTKHNDQHTPLLKELENHYKDILNILLSPSEQEGLSNTPHRVAQTMIELTRGYKEDAIALLRDASFEEAHQKMIVVQDISFFSMCEHHLVPFFGKVHIAYIPNKHIAGLSRIAKVVDIFSHRFQVQERFTYQIMNCIRQALQPKGVMVYVTAEHMCMQMRGEEKQGTVVATTNYCGAFEAVELRNEFLSMIQTTKK